MSDLTQFISQDGFDHEGFIKAVLKAVGLENSPEDVKESLKLEIGKRLEVRIIKVLVSLLSAEQVKEFEQIMAQNDEEDPFDLLLEKIHTNPDAPRILKKALEDLFEEMVLDIDDVSKIYKKYHPEEGDL